ncbi:hypothetical protein [Lentimicrobium sp.]|nr:hypothetical protein [Lentimicrobium sp.]
MAIGTARPPVTKCKTPLFSASTGGMVVPAPLWCMVVSAPPDHQ